MATTASVSLSHDILSKTAKTLFQFPSEGFVAGEYVQTLDTAGH